MPGLALVKFFKKHISVKIIIKCRRDCLRAQVDVPGK